MNLYFHGTCKCLMISYDFRWARGYFFSISREKNEEICGENRCVAVLLIQVDRQLVTRAGKEPGYVRIKLFVQGM